MIEELSRTDKSQSKYILILTVERKLLLFHEQLIFKEDKRYILQAVQDFTMFFFFFFVIVGAKNA